MKWLNFEIMYAYVLCVIAIGFHSIEGKKNGFSYGSPARRIRELDPGQKYDLPREQMNSNVRLGRADDVIYRFPRSNPPPRSGENFIITEGRLKEIRSELLYWYSDKGGDDNNGDYQTRIQHATPRIHKNLNFHLPFFGFRFNYTRVTMHGYLEFSDAPAEQSYPLKFPNRDWPKMKDHSFIGIFYSKCRIGELKSTDADRRRPGVYLRLERDLQSRTDQLGVEMRERLMWDIREGIIGADTFIPKHAIIVTWKNMSFAGGISKSAQVTNTFQLVLATDEVYTYAIFNYAEMQWTSHTEAGGDTTLGEGGVPAYVGFNAGNGTKSYEYYPYSQRSTIRDLVGRGWTNGFPGRHIFRIDENILLGSCNRATAEPFSALVLAPESGNMLGGTIVNITGPCFEPNMKVTCKFDTVEVTGRVIDRNRAVCVQPFLTVDGHIILEVTVGDEIYKWLGEFFVETPATATEKIFIESEAVHRNDTKENITIKWNRQNLTTNYEARLKLTLWGYKKSTKSELLCIDVLEDNIPNTGSYNILPEVYSSRNNTAFRDLHFGFLQITLSDPGKYSQYGLSSVLWSKPIPLGWYFAPQWEREYGVRWSEHLCNQWIENDRNLKNFTAELPQCPCTLEQALADKGQYLPDFECDIASNPSCFYNKGARHCVRSGVPSLNGGEQQCCYDRNGYLMSTYDQLWGSKPRRSHNLGQLTRNESTNVATLFQWFHDITPFYSCCLWQEEHSSGCETFRYERRPTPDCKAYQSPNIATVFGDLHFITFDDVDYTFNGKGEFVLVHTDTDKHKLDVQGRFEQVADNIYGPVKATRLTSVVARSTFPQFEVRLRPQEAQWKYRLDVLMAGKPIYFDRTPLKIQYFNGVSVYTPIQILNQSEVVIMFESGVGVEVLENKGSMSVRVYLPREFINQTKGLLGTWNFDPFDDFTLPDGTILNINRTDFRSIHENFGMHWILDDHFEFFKGKVLFYDEYGKTADYYANRTFVPEYRRTPEEIIPPNRTIDILTANKICGNSYQCKYDYSVSLDKEFAKNTLKSLDSFVNIKQILKNKVITCEVLKTPRFGRKNTFLFTPGIRVTFECDRDFVIVGDQKRFCEVEGRWNVPVFGYTECIPLSEYESRTARISTSTPKP